MVFAQVHEEPVQAFLYYVKGEGKVSSRKHGKNSFAKKDELTGETKGQMYIASSSKPYYPLLALNLKKELREDIYESKHFWRGLCDGDGTVAWVKNRGYRYPVIAWSGSLHDMTRCADWIEGFGYKRPKVGTARSIFRVSVNGSTAVRLIEHLYRGEYSALNYKRKIAEECLIWRTKHSAMVRDKKVAEDLAADL